MNELVNQKILWKYKEARLGKEPDDDESPTVIMNIISPPRMTPVEDQGIDTLLFKHKIIEHKFIIESP